MKELDTYNVLYEYNGVGRDVVIPEGINRIGSEAFDRSITLTSVALPDSLRDIFSEAFVNCPNLRRVCLPDSIEYVAGDAFEGCPMEIFNTDGEGYYLGNEKNPYLCFYRPVDRDTEHISIQPGTKIFAAGAFSRCERLKELMIPEGVRHIEYGTFYRCIALEKLSVPDTVCWINTDAFRFCPKSIYHTDGVGKYLGNDENPYVIFCGCISNEVVDVKLRPGTKGIGTDAFKALEGLASVEIPQGATEIGSGAFQSCQNLQRVTIPGSVMEIGRWAVDECPRLTVYTPAGSAAADYCERRGIPVQYVSQI